MLRTPSRSSADSDPPASLSPEMGRVIAEAQAEMDQLVRLGGLQNDPIRHPIQALSVHLGALHALMLNNGQMLAKQIQAARQAVDDEDIRRLSLAAANGAERRAAELARSANLRTAAVATVLILALMCASAAAGSMWRGSAPDISGMTCQDQAGGGRACWVWVVPPPQRGQQPATTGER
jgi:hypothetical protein